MQTSLPPFTLIIPAAGNGLRMGTKTPKQYTNINGKPILRHTIEKFYDMPECTQICVIIDPDHAELFHDTIQGFNNIEIIHGGKERNESIFNALNHLSNKKHEGIILIHDAARPCVHQADIQNLLRAMNTHRAATLASIVTSTLRKGDNKDIAQDTLSRDNLWHIQTPQAFRYDDLLKAHQQADPQKHYTDDTQLVSALGIPVKLVSTSPENIKITMPEDIATAQKLLTPKMENRIGQGFDVHAFDTEKPGPVRICGIDISHDHKLKGHSDADVGLHALTDALYGAIGAGDIGIHFPPSNNEFKDMDSAIFLKHAIDMLAEQGGRIVNADITLICEKPKIGPHAEKMRQRIAEICGIEQQRINIKATTTEQLGFTGRKEGIAAQAIINISLPHIPHPNPPPLRGRDTKSSDYTAMVTHPSPPSSRGRDEKA